MQERLLQELVDNDFSDDTEVTPELIEKLTFQESYIKEMQRLHNPSYQPGRTAQVDMILPGGYKIKKGSVIIGEYRYLRPRIPVANPFKVPSITFTTTHNTGRTQPSSIQIVGRPTKSRTFPNLHTFPSQQARECVSASTLRSRRLKYSFPNLFGAINGSRKGMPRSSTILSSSSFDP